MGAGNSSLLHFVYTGDKYMPRPIQYGQRARFNAEVETMVSPPTKFAINDRHDALREAVLDNLGRPDDLVDVVVHALWDEDHYRVNIYREIKNVNRITDSYFVSITDDAVIASPRIDRKYYDDVLEKLSLDKSE